MSDIEKAINALKDLYRFAKIEANISWKQSFAAKENKDYRAADRAASYAKAMQNIKQRCLTISREQFLVDLEDREVP